MATLADPDGDRLPETEIEAVPVAGAEFAGWRAEVEEAYAVDLATNGGLTDAQARRKASSDTAALLPEGVTTPGHEIGWLQHAGERVGRLWVAERTVHGERMLFVYDVEVDIEHRGRGHGRAAMLLVEAIARRRGIDQIGLNVFGGNSVARSLYRSLGYVERAVTMGKHLGDPRQSR
jgi:ribosomal protein S18 acetylase RimI-like enzyme